MGAKSEDRTPCGGFAPLRPLSRARAYSYPLVKIRSSRQGNVSKGDVGASVEDYHCDPSDWEGEAGGSGILGYPQSYGA